jgi:hypothetical protein
MINKMKKYDIKDLNMNGKTLFTACLTALFTLSGCAMFQKAPAEKNTLQTNVNTQACLEGTCETDPFINYTQTRADYRRYGELSERDVLVSEAGAGNNLSAAIPPSVESEVIEYEERLVNDTLQDEESVSEVVDTPASDVVQDVQNVDEEALPVNQADNLQTPQNVEAQQIITSETNVPAGENNPLTASTEKLSDENVAPETLVAESSITTQVEPDTVVEQTTQEQVVNEEEAQNKMQDEEDDEDDGEEDPIRDWYAEEGQNLKALLTEWSERSGWRIVWNTNRNYILNAGAMFRGRFADVSSALIRAFARARPAPIATFYKGNRVLVIETMEDENAYD